MMNTTKLIVGATVVVLGGIGIYAWSKDTANDQMMEQGAMMEGGERGMMNAKEVEVTLHAQNGSQQQGMAILSEMDGKTRVVVRVDNAPSGSSQPMHIHVGSCPTPGAVKYPLNSLVSGKSETILDVTLAQLAGEAPLAINAHRSSTDLKTYVSCGDLPAKDAMMKSGENSMVEGGTVMMEGKDMMMEDAMMKAGSYEAYAPEKVSLASATHDVVLFFKADWCPTCIALDKDIRANLGKIPADLTILYVDYDNATDLKKKYGVTYQHTLVQVDKTGDLIKKWSGSPTLTALVTEAQ